MLRPALSLLISFLFTVVFMPLVIHLMKKLKARQTILHYVENHASKGGTPTMGGIGFIIPIVIASLSFMTSQHSLMLLALLVTVGYGVIGFLDDFIKVFFKQNKGLSAWQKILFQVALAVVVAIFAYRNQFVGDTLYIPFTLNPLHIGIFAIPLYIFMFLAFTNGVNLTDGLDALASKVTIIFFIIFSILTSLIIYFFGDGQAFKEEYINILIFNMAVIGSLVGFVCYNGFPASVFMGDTGSLALGGAVASVSIVSGLTLMSPIVGVMYVVTCLSVAIQVLYYKKTKKRIFLMAPLHHHFEKKGMHENRIVIMYTAITAVVGVVSIVLTLVFNG